MKLDSFRELLAKKCEDPNLEYLIKFMRDDILADAVMESLEKMARAKHKGDAANLAVRDFGLEMDPELEPKMIHDALSHHASRYKSALKEGRQNLANDHAKQIFKIMDMADQAQKHSHGKLDVQAVSPHAWERNVKTKRFEEGDAPVVRGSKKPGQFVTDTKGWRYRGGDYSFLQQPPHEHYRDEIRRHGHNEAYPLEQIRVNGKYLHIEDVPPEQLLGHEKHPFDHHPIMDHFQMPASKRNQKDDEKYLAHKEAFHDSPHMDSFFDKHEAMQNENPEAYKTRGLKPSDKVHGPVENPLDLEKKPQAVQKPKEAAAPTGGDITDEHLSHVQNANIPADIKASILKRLKGSE